MDLILFIIFIILYLYFIFRAGWVIANLKFLNTKITIYLIEEGIPEIQKNRCYNIPLYTNYFLNLTCFNFYYWLLVKPFCYRIDKIIGENLYKKIFKGK